MRATMLEFLAILSSGLFAGAALYITLVEHPVRSMLDTRSAALQWAPSDRRSTWTQAPFAVIACLSGALVAFQGGGWGWLVGALLIGSVVPITIKMMTPTVRTLQDPQRDLGGPGTRAQLTKWGTLHALRMWLGVAAFVVFAWQLIRG